MRHWNCPTCGALVKREIHPDGLIMAKACAQRGFCLFCEEPLKFKRKPRWVCPGIECRRAYLAAYFRDRRFARVSALKREAA